MPYKFPAFTPLLDFRVKGSNTTQAGYLDKVASPDVSAEERSNRRSRGLCAACGRPLVLHAFDSLGATWTCSCGYRTTALPRSSLYRRARDQREQEAARR